MLKRKIAEILRKINLLQAADNIIFIGEYLKNRKANLDFKKRHPHFLTPPPHLAYDAYNHVNWENYQRTGLKHAELISHLIRKHLSESEIRICEWGCGPARVLRHLKTIDGLNNVELIGTDYNKESINWCKKHINKILFINNNLEPPLPLEVKDCDCIYAISIFTHLSEKMHHAWIEELFGRLKPNGILIFTTHGDLLKHELLARDRRKYELGLLVTNEKTKEGKKHFAAYHPPDFVRKNLLKNYQLLEHISDPSGYLLMHEVWIAKKSSSNNS